MLLNFIQPLKLIIFFSELKIIKILESYSCFTLNKLHFRFWVAAEKLLGCTTILSLIMYFCFKKHFQCKCFKRFIFSPYLLIERLSHMMDTSKAPMVNYAMLNLVYKQIPIFFSKSLKRSWIFIYFAIL